MQQGLLKLLEGDVYKRQTEQRLLTEVEIPLLYVLMHMEQRGIVLDIEALQRSRQELLESVLRLEKEIQSYSSRGLNLKVNSPKQIGELLFDELKIVEKPRKTKTGSYVTNEETLLPLRSLHPVVALILDSVSYTHLDVYKRQPRRCAPLRNRLSLVARSPGKSRQSCCAPGCRRPAV